MGVLRPIRLGAAALALVACLSAAAGPGVNSACMDCHADKALTTTNAAGKEISLFVDQAKLAASVHRTNTCISCHADISPKHPDDNVPVKPATCSGCHQAQWESYGASVHGMALARSEKNAATSFQVSKAGFA